MRGPNRQFSLHAAAATYPRWISPALCREVARIYAQITGHPAYPEALRL